MLWNRCNKNNGINNSQNHDDNGIIWPLAVAPYHVNVIPVNTKDEMQMKVANDIYEELKAIGIDVIFDDRKERAELSLKIQTLWEYQ